MIPVPTTNTSLNKEQARDGLLSAWGAGLTKQIARGLLSLIWIESGAGKSLHNFNVGNISASQKYQGKVWIPPWVAEPGPDASPRTVFLHKESLAGRAPIAFRAYDSFSQGFSDYVGMLKRNFPEVIEAARTGTPDSFRIALSKKYSHDYSNPKATATFEQLWKQFEPVLTLLPSEASEVASGVPLAGQESSSLEPSEPSCGSSPLPEAGFLRNQKYSVPGIQDEPEKK